jgi:peptidoglycan/LPS O-acetylase OafA/YrhL
MAMKSKLDLIDFLRGFSIFTIVVYHFLKALKISPTVDQLIQFGGTGVHLFMLLSGFGLYLSYLHKPIAYGQFLKKRMSKIYLPHVVIVLFSLLVAFFIPIYDVSGYAFLGHVLFYKMFDNAIIGSFGYQLWFLSAIIQFYLVFHLLVFAKKKISSPWVIVIALSISVGWGLFVVQSGHANERNWNSFFLQFLWEFMLGMVLASWWYRGKQKQLATPVWLILGITGVTLYALLALKMGQTGRLFNDIPALVGYSSLAIFLYRINIPYVNSFFRFTGEISFSLYLSHVLIFLSLKYLLDALGVNGFITLSLALVLSYVFSFYYQKFINKTYKVMGI